MTEWEIGARRARHLRTILLPNDGAGMAHVLPLIEAGHGDGLLVGIPRRAFACA